jgi:hypothetical protein
MSICLSATSVPPPIAPFSLLQLPSSFLPLPSTILPSFSSSRASLLPPPRFHQLRLFLHLPPFSFMKIIGGMWKVVSAEEKVCIICLVLKVVVVVKGVNVSKTVGDRSLSLIPLKAIPTSSPPPPNAPPFFQSTHAPSRVPFYPFSTPFLFFLLCTRLNFKAGQMRTRLATRMK